MLDKNTFYKILRFRNNAENISHLYKKNKSKMYDLINKKHEKLRKELIQEKDNTKKGYE